MAAGDAQAAATFVRRYQARVYGLAKTIVGAASAEEVAQEAFLRAWRYAGGYDPRRGGAATWLLSIARNAAIDALRMRRDQPYEPEALLAILDTLNPGTGSQDSLLDAEQVRSALRALPHDQAVAVVMAAFYGLTAREIADHQGVPVGTAKTRIRLGLAKMRDQLEVSDE